MIAEEVGEESKYPGHKMAQQVGRFQIVPYSDFLLFSPERIAPTLRRFQESDDPERQVIVEAVLDVVQSDEPEQWESHWETFMETGLHKIVVDILCDDRTYATGVSEGYPAWTFVLLRRFGVWLSKKLNRDPDDPITHMQVDELLELLPRLWEYTWKKEIIKHKVPLRMYRYKNESEDLSISFIHTIDIMNNLYILKCNEALPVTNHIGHLALWVWTHSIDYRYDELMLRVLILVVDTATREELPGFFKEAVLDKGITLPLHERFCKELVDEYNVNESLRGITSFLSAISVHCAPVLHVKTKETDQEMFTEQVARKARGEDTEKTLMQCIRIACQRQMCQQRSDADTNSVLGASLSVIKDIMQDSLEPGSGKHLPAFFEMVDTAKILPMVARTTIHAIKRNDPSLFHCLQFILEMYGISGETCRRTSIPHVMDKIFIMSRDLWYPTVQSIRALSFDETSKASQVRLRDWALKVWLTFGQKLGFNEKVEERRWKAAEKGSEPWSRGRPGWGELSVSAGRGMGLKMCHWKECLCSGEERPPHKMKVCKGCWRVWYCGANCQTRDWNEGDHKEYCLSHRET